MLVLTGAGIVGLLGLPGNTLDIDGCLDQNMLVLVPLMAGVLQRKNKDALGTLVMQQILTAILSRAGLDKQARGLAGIFIDEFPDFVGTTGEAVGILLAQARKFGASVALAAQSLEQLAANPRVMTESETNCRNKLFYAMDARDARRAVELLGAGRLLTPDDMTAAGKFRGYLRPTVDRAPAPPAYVRFLPPVESIRQTTDERQKTEPLPLPNHPGKSAMDLARKAYKAYWAAVKKGREAQGRRGVAGFLAGLSDANWQGYQAGREQTWVVGRREIPRRTEQPDRLTCLWAAQVGMGQRARQFWRPARQDACLAQARSQGVGLPESIAVYHLTPWLMCSTCRVSLVVGGACLNPACPSRRGPDSDYHGAPLVQIRDGVFLYAPDRPGWVEEKDGQVRGIVGDALVQMLAPERVLVRQASEYTALLIARLMSFT